MDLSNCNPYIRAAEIQPAVLEGTGPRKAYDYRLFCILENRGTIHLGGNSIDISPDTVIVIPPATEYYFTGKMKTLVLNFDITRRFSHRKEPICPPPTAFFDPSAQFETELLDIFASPMIFHCGAGVQEHLLDICTEFNSGSEFSDAITSATLKLVFAKLPCQEDSGDSRLRDRILSHIRLHAASIRSNADVAEAFGYHPVYLGEVFRQVTGVTLHNAILDEKIRLACRWLTQTDTAVADIVYAAGFSSRTHFSTVFKAKTGKTPSEYRKSARSATERHNLH